MVLNGKTIGKHAVIKNRSIARNDFYTRTGRTMRKIIALAAVWAPNSFLLRGPNPIVVGSTVPATSPKTFARVSGRAGYFSAGYSTAGQYDRRKRFTRYVSSGKPVKILPPSVESHGAAFLISRIPPSAVYRVRFLSCLRNVFYKGTTGSQLYRTAVVRVHTHVYYNGTANILFPTVTRVPR